MPAPQNASFVAACKAEYEEMLGKCAESSQIQEALLLRMVAQNSETTYGRKHSFARIKSVSDYMNSVPITGYADYEPYLARIIGGESNVLSSSQLYKYISSSGSTSSPKVLPITQDYVVSAFVPFYRRALGAIAKMIPSIEPDWNQVLNMKWDPNRSKNVIADKDYVGLSQIDFSSDFDGGPSEPGTGVPWCEIPADICSDLDRIYYKLRVAADHDIRHIIGINPRIVANLPQFLEERKHQLLTDIHRGECLGRPVAEPNEALAARLQRRIAEEGCLRPKHLWPNMTSIVCWDGSLACLYIDGFKANYGDSVVVIPAPLAASEAPLAIPFSAADRTSLISYDSVFYEFIDIDGSPESSPLLLNELKAGRYYSVIVTTQSGLYRYSLGDIVQVKEHFDSVPLIQYAGRSNSVSGCAFNERDILSSMRHLIEHGLMGFVGGFAEAAADSPAVRLYIESDQQFDVGQFSSLLNDYLSNLPAPVDTSSKTRPAELIALKKNYLYEDWKDRIESGMRPAQVKDKLFYLFTGEPA